MVAINIDRFVKRYGSVQVVHDISFDIAEGEFLVLVGPSGCGKSTILRMVAGLEEISDGELRMQGTRVNELTPKERQVAMVFQDYALYPHMSVEQNIGFSLELARVPKPERQEQARLVLAGIAGASAVIVGVTARAVSMATSSVEAIRRGLRLPAARSSVTIPVGAELDVPGITPLITPNADFYRVDTALTVPTVDPAAWRLVIDGMVDRRVELTFDDLVGMGLDAYAITLTCVSNVVGGELVNNGTTCKMW